MRRRGATLLEALIVTGCLILALAIALPVTARFASDSGEARSLGNLRTLAASHEAYSQSFGGRQYTAIPDDAGTVAGNCTAYLATVACPPQLLLGQSPSGPWWGYFLGTSGLCAPYSQPGSCANWVVYKSIEWNGADAGFGSFRLSNAKSLNAFVDGRYYSDVFFSPNDRAEYATSAVYRDQYLDFNSVNGEMAFSSYCMSPAAMLNPAVLAAANGGFKNPNTFVDGYVSPGVSQCVYPELKTRMIEHQWNVGAPSATALSQLGWTFNASSRAAPNGFFFDGHVARIRNADAIDDDETLFQTTGARLWSRTTPLGASGYGTWQPELETLRTSHTILTIDGILGRDLLTVR